MLMQTSIFFLGFLFFASVLSAQKTAPDPPQILLWPNGAPGAQGDTENDKPSITVYPAKVNKVPMGIVVYPGGGYAHLALDHEGKQIVEWLNGQGVTAFIVRYRLGPKYHHPVELGDAQRAIRYVRRHAEEFGIKPDRIGVWGFSAGGHLASSTGTHFDSGKPDAPDPLDRVSSRPDFMILSYPVISMSAPYTHIGSRDNLLGKNADPQLLELLSNEKQVTKDTPPTFLFHTTDDPVVPVENAIAFYLALRKAGVPAEMHIYEHGPHGVGLALNNPVLGSWPRRLSAWLRARGLLNP